MAVNYIWPGTLPQLVGPNYKEDIGALILRTPMDKGPAKQRRTGRKPTPLSVSIEMTTAQVDILETFVLTTLNATSRFGFPHPRKNTQVEVRIIPEAEGKLYDLSYVAPGWWQVTMKLEVLP